MSIVYNKSMKKAGKVILFDTLAIIFMLLGLILSPVPGPFSIPLYILGLSLLARNHHWARRMFKYFENKADEILPAKYAKIIAVLVVALIFLVGLIIMLVMYAMQSSN